VILQIWEATNAKGMKIHILSRSELYSYTLEMDEHV